MKHTKIKKSIIFSCFAVLFLGLAITAFCAEPPKKIYLSERQEFEQKAAEKFDKTAKELGLTQDQIAQMKEIREQNKIKTKQIIEEIRKKDRAIDEELLKENYDRVAVNNLLQEIRQLSADMSQIRIDDKIKVRSILTQEQFSKIEQNKKEFLLKHKNQKDKNNK